jgi:mono/diheme cytochrome c family protein
MSGGPGRGRWLGLAIVGLGLLLAEGAPAAAQAQDGDRWIAPTRRAQRPNPVAATPETVAQGREIYLRECGSCHGATGQNDGEKAPKELAGTRRPADPSLREETDGALFWKIGEGRGSMPNTWDVLTDRERWAVVNFLRTLAPKPDEGPGR